MNLVTLIVALLNDLKTPAKVKKFLVYVATGAALLVSDHLVSGQALVITNTVLAILGGIGVYGASNAAKA